MITASETLSLVVVLLYVVLCVPRGNNCQFKTRCKGDRVTGLHLMQNNYKASNQNPTWHIMPTFICVCEQLFD